MDSRAKDLQQRLFGNMHDFHTTLTARWIDLARSRFGDEVLQRVQAAGVDRLPLYRWHMERQAALLDLLTEQYGPSAVELVCDAERANSREDGATQAREQGDNSLAALVQIFSGGNPQRVVSQSETEAVVVTRGCYSGLCAAEMGRAGLFYPLTCGLDPEFVQGFNPALGCEVRHTTMEGHEHCEHRLYVKA